MFLLIIVTTIAVVPVISGTMVNQASIAFPMVIIPDLPVQDMKPV